MRNETILIVDDVELNRAILAELFQDSYAILEAADGREALKVMRERHADIVMALLDIIMPVMDGYEVLRVMNTEGLIRKIPVVLITSENSDAASLKSYDLGVTDIINKPFHPSIVKRRVGNIIELYRHKAKLEHLVSSQVRALEKQAGQISRAHTFVIDALSSVIEFRSCESGHHIKRIRRLTHQLLERLMARYPHYGLDSRSIKKIALSSSLHDIGKIAVPDAILNKPGRLTPEEFEIMKTHTVKGCELLRHAVDGLDESPYRYSYDICRSHHERWDGRGYPDGLAGEAIPISAQVVALADVYDALTNERRYEQAFSHAQAVDMILGGECGAFNPDLIEVFKLVADSLNSGEEGDTHPVKSLSREAVLPDEFSLSPGDNDDNDDNSKNATHRTGESISDRTLRLLEREREKNRIVTELSGDIVFNYDALADTMEFSEKYHEEFGRDTLLQHARKAVLHSPVIHPDDREVLLYRLLHLAPLKPRESLELRMLTKAGVYEWFEVYSRAVKDPDDESRCVGLIGKLVNIHERKAENSRLLEQASTDALTGLDNRMRFEERVAGVLRNHDGALCALMFLDIDDFKTVNDTRGHLEGDNVLRRVASGIRAQLRDSDVVGRVGGDEFVVFMRNISSRDDVARKAGQICAACTASDAAEGQTPVSCSLGIALCPANGTDYQQLMAQADKALYAAKALGKNRYAFLDDIRA